MTKLKVMPEAWPFLKPVNKKQVKDYYSVIKKPIDMETMGKKIKGAYLWFRKREKFCLFCLCNIQGGHTHTFKWVTMGGYKTVRWKEKKPVKTFW